MTSRHRCCWLEICRWWRRYTFVAASSRQARQSGCAAVNISFNVLTSYAVSYCVWFSAPKTALFMVKSSTKEQHCDISEAQNVAVLKSCCDSCLFVHLCCALTLCCTSLWCKVCGCLLSKVFLHIQIMIPCAHWVLLKSGALRVDGTVITQYLAIGKWQKHCVVTEITTLFAACLAVCLR